MAEQLAELNRGGTTQVGEYGINMSAITAAASTWIKVCSIDTSNLKGKYLAMTNVSDAVESKLYYARIAHDGVVDTYNINTPYGTGNLSGLIDVTSYNSLDFWIYGQAQTIAQYHTVLRAYKL